MADEARGILGKLEATGEEIRRAWERAALLAMEKHREAGVPMATWDWENNRVLMIPADEIPIPGADSLVGVAGPGSDA